MEYSTITERLYVGTPPRSPQDYETLQSLGVKLVINMRVEQRPSPDAPVETLWLRTFDNVLFPIPLRALQQGVKAALATFDAGGSVFVHCAAGVHRSVAMACCILIAQGHPPNSAMTLVKEKRPIADPYAWHIKRRIMRFAKEHQQRE